MIIDPSSVLSECDIPIWPGCQLPLSVGHFSFFERTNLYIFFPLSPWVFMGVVTTNTSYHCACYFKKKWGKWDGYFDIEFLAYASSALVGRVMVENVKCQSSAQNNVSTIKKNPVIHFPLSALYFSTPLL